MYKVYVHHRSKIRIMTHCLMYYYASVIHRNTLN